MIALGVSEISVSFGVEKILDRVSFSLEEGTKTAIVGVNGAGKSTLLKVICGSLSADGGQVFLDKGKSVGFLRQEQALDSESTVFDEMLKVFEPQIRLENRIAELEEALKNDQSPELIARFDRVCEDYRRLGGYEYKSRTASTLIELGFPEELHSVRVNSLSGGQKTTLALARLLLESPDIMILDEPTNHLDLDAVRWLEDYIRSSRSTFIIVSHDRYFLDRTTEHTLEIENAHARLYNLSYTAYREQKKKDREIAERHYENQQREIARLNAFIEQQRRWNRERNIIAAESREKAIARMEKVARPEDEPDKLKFSFNTAIRSGNDVLEVRELGKAFGENRLFSDISFEVKKDERLFLLGRNGCGKSTLLKMLIGRVGDYEGSFEFGYNVKIGYYDQEYQDLNDSNTVLDELWQSGDFTQTEIRSLLAMFLFRGDDVFKEVRVLSGGEKARLTLAKLMQKKVNLLILDEPTNHLDIYSREALENALDKFDGTIIAVSHDRYFIKSLATRILVLPSGDDFIGGYEEYDERIREAKRREKPAVKKQSDSKSRYLENKKAASEERKKKKRLESAKERIPIIEHEIEELDRRISEEDQSDYKLIEELFREKCEKEKELEELYEIAL